MSDGGPTIGEGAKELTEVTKWVWSNRAAVKKSLKSLWEWFRGTWSGNSSNDSSRLLIIGPGGVGKSTLGKILSGEFDYLFDIPDGYKESVFTEKYQLTDEI